MSKTIVGITGKKGHGKTTAARALMEDGFEHICFADPLKQVAAIVYGLTEDEMTILALKEKPLDRWPYKSPRELLQYIGTEMFRAYLPETWTKAFERRCEPFDKVVCSDLRFLNEAECLRIMQTPPEQLDLFETWTDVVVLRVVDPRWATDGDEDSTKLHSSETEMDKIEVDWTLINDTTVDALHAAIRAVVN